MGKEIVQTELAPAPIGPYSQGVVANGFIYTSGQIPLDLSTGQVIDGGVAEQTELVLSYVKAIIEKAGSDISKVVKVTVFLKDMNDFVAMNEVYCKVFDGDDPPARAAVEVARLPKDVLVEIEAIALLK